MSRAISLASLIAVLAAGLSGHAHADESSVYETLQDVSSAEPSPVYETLRNVFVGPLFLTPAQRSWLDARRNAPELPASGTRAATDDDTPAAPVAKPAGFIIRSDGSQRRWSDGDFVLSRGVSVESMKFPGDVKVKRHQVRRKPEQTDDREQQ